MSNEKNSRPTIGINFGVVTISGIPIAIPDTIFKRFRLLFQVLIRGLPAQQLSQATAILLAGGTSERWAKSVEEPGLQDLPEDCPKPDPRPSPHKSCAPLLGQSPIQRALISFQAHGIRNTKVCVPPDSDEPSCKAIRHHLAPYKNRLFMEKIDEIPSSLNIVESLRKALGEVKLNYQESIIAAYSDIIWPVTMMNRLINESEGDIVVLVDTTWRIYNYPDFRKWHDKTYAELVYGRGGKFESAGEVVTCFPPDFNHKLSFDDSISLENLFRDQKQCIGEVVGLFKFTEQGRDKFICCYDRAKSTSEEVSMPDFSSLCGSELMSVKLLKSISLDKVLVASFLAHIERQHPGTVKLVPTQHCRWFEIDHWGDAYIANRELHSWDGYSGERYLSDIAYNEIRNTDAEQFNAPDFT